jgi:hypothetical protein
VALAACDGAIANNALEQGDGSTSSSGDKPVDASAHPLDAAIDATGTLDDASGDEAAANDAAGGAANDASTDGGAAEGSAGKIACGSEFCDRATQYCHEYSYCGYAPGNDIYGAVVAKKCDTLWSCDAGSAADGASTANDAAISEAGPQTLCECSPFGPYVGCMMEDGGGVSINEVMSQCGCYGSPPTRLERLLAVG